jgi:hypothetical protein
MKSDALTLITKAIRSRETVELTIKHDASEATVTAFVTCMSIMDLSSQDGVDHRLDEVTLKVVL